MSDLAGPSICRALREARMTSRLTKAEVARRMGVTAVTYVSWERGARGVRIDWVPALAAALEVSVADLITWSAL